MDLNLAPGNTPHLLSNISEKAGTSGIDQSQDYSLLLNVNASRRSKRIEANMLKKLPGLTRKASDLSHLEGGRAELHGMSFLKKGASSQKRYKSSNYHFGQKFGEKFQNSDGSIVKEALSNSYLCRSANDVTEGLVGFRYALVCGQTR